MEIGVPAGAYDLSAEIDKVNAPRLLRRTDGDFIAQGQFEADLPPTVYVGGAAVNASQAPFTAEFEGLTAVPAPVK